jgi:uracil phosphoribosyltransferase
MAAVTDNCVELASENALIALELTVLRDVRTDRRTFKRSAKRLAMLLAAEVGSREVAIVPTKVTTPLGVADGFIPKDKIAIATVLRAALALEDTFDDVLRADRVVHIGLCRDETTAKADQYYPVKGRSLPDLQEYIAFLIDPMLASGGSANSSLSILRNAGAKKMVMASVVAAPEGVEAVRRQHPDVMIYTCDFDKGLDHRKFIVPGLGDFGDRLYGT